MSTKLELERALEAVRPYDRAVREVFVAFGLKRLKRVALYVAPWVHDSTRHFAATKTDGRTVVLAPEAADLPDETLLAILAHEYGHAADYAYPGRFLLIDGELTDFWPEDGPLPAGLERRWLLRNDQWEERSDDDVERTADAIAERVTSKRIGYVGPCQLQAFDRGRARPQGLR